MRIHSSTIVHIKLETDSRFRAADKVPSVRSGDRTEVSVDELELRGTSVWAKGYLVRKDGKVGTGRRTILLDVDDLPLRVITELARFFLNQDSTT